MKYIITLAAIVLIAEVITLINIKHNIDCQVSEQHRSDSLRLNFEIKPDSHDNLHIHFIDINP